MSEEPSITPEKFRGRQASEEAEAAAALEGKQRREAKRIGARVLRNAQKGKAITVVRGGRFGLRNTLHPPSVYAHVQEHLFPHQLEIETHAYPNRLADYRANRVHHEVIIRKSQGQEVIEPPPSYYEPSKIYPPDEPQ